MLSILSRLIRVPFADIPRSCTSTPGPYLTISSCVSVLMVRYRARGKFGEHERGVRVARGLRDVKRSINLVFPFQWRCLCHVHWIHPHLGGQRRGRWSSELLGIASCYARTSSDSRGILKHFTKCCDFPQTALGCYCCRTYCDIGQYSLLTTRRLFSKSKSRQKRKSNNCFLVINP